MAPEEPPLAEVAWRMRALETTVGKLDARTTEALATLSTQVASLGFVRQDLYESERAAFVRDLAALRKELEEVPERAEVAALRRDLEGVSHLVKMVLGAVMAMLFGGIGTVLIAIARSVG